MLPSISKDKWDATIMPDPRVKHFWDGELGAARWFAKQVDGYEGVSWDMYYLYGPGAIWETETIPGPLMDSRGTIYGERQTLMTQVSALLGE
jgi:hypothetical protein